MTTTLSSAEDIHPQDRQLIQVAYQAFNARHINAVLALMTPDVDWPNGMEGGYVKGHAAVRSYWTRQWETLDPTVEPVNITKDEAARLVVDVHQTIKDLAGNLLVDQLVQHIYQLKNGLIVRMEIVSPT